MKDEEMAEEHKADYGIDLCCLCRECDVGNINPCQHKKDAMYGYQDGFLAGLKAGRPQWHDLQKDPNDLPKVGVQVLSEKGTLVIYKGVGFYWVEYSPNADNIKLRKWEEPIAWCEIPTFDKE